MNINSVVEGYIPSSAPLLVPVWGEYSPKISHVMAVRKVAFVCFCSPVCIETTLLLHVVALSHAQGLSTSWRCATEMLGLYV